MNPNKESAAFFTAIFTKNLPGKTYQFEETIDKYIRGKNPKSSVYIHYEHGLGDKLGNFQECLKRIEKNFGDIGESTFSIKNYSNESVEKMVVIQWKNPLQRRLSFQIPHQ